MRVLLRAVLVALLLCACSEAEPEPEPRRTCYSGSYESLGPEAFATAPPC